MLIFYILLLLLPLWGCKVAGKKFFVEESFSKSVTDSIKGIFIWLVFFSHFASYVQYTSKIDVLGHKISIVLGQLIVACFLFYSGYGVCEAIKRKGTSYVRSIPKNRIAKTLLHFDIAVLLFLIIQLCLGNTYSFSRIALSLIGWEAVGNSNWYIFVILALYLITWIAFTCAKNNLIQSGIFVTFLTFALIGFLYLTRWSWWYDTALCYVLGIWVSVFKDKFLSLITKSNFIWLICGFASIGLFGLLFLYRFPNYSKLNLIFSLLSAPAFCLVITVFLTKVKISNKLLVFSGQYLFEIYILQRIPMILLKEWGIADMNLYLYFLLCLAATIALSFAFRFTIKKVDALVFS